MELLERRPLSILAADDSAVMRGILRTLFIRHAANTNSTLPRMTLLSIAKDGMECLEMVERESPDIIILDLEMPRMDGLAVLDALRRSGKSVPVIMCSSYTEEGAHATLDALERGAADYVMKPSGHRDFEASLVQLAQDLLPRIAALTMRRIPRRPSVRRVVEPPVAHSLHRIASEATQKIEVVLIGVSTGGPAALERLLPLLTDDFPVPVLIVQHMPKLFTGVLAQRLNRVCPLQVEEAYHGAPLHPGTIWLAPGDTHMEVMPALGHCENAKDRQRCTAIKLHKQEPLNHYRPSVDYLFHSAARVFGTGAMALVLTGMGSDGLDGARAIHAAGGLVYAQDEQTAAVWGMPGRVAESGIATAVLSLPAMAREVNLRVKANRQAPRNSPALSTRAVSMEAIHGLL